MASVSVDFAPAVANANVSSVWQFYFVEAFTSNVVATPSVTLSGSGASPGVLTPSSTSLDFGTVSVGSRSVLSVMYTNTGGSTVTGTSLMPPALPFEATYNECANATIAPTGTCLVVINFTPTYGGSFTQMVSAMGMTGSAQPVQSLPTILYGTGLAPMPSMMPMPTPITPTPVAGVCSVGAWNSPKTSCTGNILKQGTMNGADAPGIGEGNAARFCGAAQLSLGRGSCCMFHLYGQGQWYLTDGTVQSVGRICEGTSSCYAGGNCY